MLYCRRPNWFEIWWHMNHMAWPRGPTWSQLCNKLRNVVNIAPIHTRKAAIDSSHRDLRVAIFKPNFCCQSQCDFVLVIIVLLWALRKERKNQLGRRGNLCFLWASWLCLRHLQTHEAYHVNHYNTSSSVLLSSTLPKPGFRFNN